MKIVLPKERPTSWNKFYSGMHWTQRKAEAERVHDLVVYEAYKQIGINNIRKFELPVDITIVAYFAKSWQDADNIAAKLYVDGLKYLLLKDDSPKWVQSVTTTSAIDRDNPRVEIEIDVVS